MISNRRKASFRKHKDSGVSEVIGDILILAMTVTLFSTVFVFVNAFPTPNAQTFVNFEATLSPPVSINGFPSNTTFLNITHEGGQALTSSLTSVVVQVNQNTSVFTLPSGYVSVNPVSGWSNLRWTTDQTWIMNLTHVTQSSVVGVSIIDKANNYVVWSTVLNGKPSHAYPVLQNAWALPNPVKPGSSITINASIYNGGSGSITLTANVTLLNNSASITPAKMPMYLNPLSGFYNTSTFTVNKSTPLGQYPVSVTLSRTTGGTHLFTSNYTFIVNVENSGPAIVTASINPNPSTPGSSFNITAYVLDSNPQASIQSVTVKPLGPSYMGILNGSNKSVESMKLSQYQGVYILEGNVSSNANFTQFESFELTATDSFGSNATYVVELFLNYFLNPNQYYPSKYLGPTSMGFSHFTWNVSGNPSSYAPGFMVNSADVNKNDPGIYFHIQLANNNASSNLYLDALSNIYIFTGANSGFAQFESFLVLNGTHGAQYANWTIQQSSPKSPYSTYSGPSHNYPSLYWSSGPGTKWGGNYSITGASQSSTNFIMLPATVGGVQVPVQVSFGAFSSGSVPTTGGPFNTGTPITSNSGAIQPGTVSANFLELFGYSLPISESPWQYFPGTAGIGIPYGQTLPFTGIYWY